MRPLDHNRFNFDSTTGKWKLKEKKKRDRQFCVASWCRNPVYKIGDKFCSRCKMRIWRMNNPIRAIWKGLRDSARRRGIPFHLDYEDFHPWLMNTPYPLARGCAGGMLHVDRIRNWEGYTLNNIQILTCTDNVKKEAQEKWNDPF